MPGRRLRDLGAVAARARLAIALASRCRSPPAACTGQGHAARSTRRHQPPKTIDEAVAQLERLTAADPKNSPTWPRSRAPTWRRKSSQKARDAYARALALQPDETTLYVEYAEAMLRTSPDRRFPPEAVALLEQALRRIRRTSARCSSSACTSARAAARRRGGDLGAPARAARRRDLDGAAQADRAARKDAGMPEAPAEATLQVE
jgi:predicted Zn-dependent protease